MTVPGQRFELDLDADNWKFDVKENEDAFPSPTVMSGIKEREPASIPAAPTLKSKTGFPAPRPRKQQSVFKQQQRTTFDQQDVIHGRGPSDRAILHHAAKRQGIDLATINEQKDIDAENRRRINQMSVEELEEARAELMSQFNPDKLRAFLQRANVDDDQEKQRKDWDGHEDARPAHPSKTSTAFVEPSLSESGLSNPTERGTQELEVEPEEDVPDHPTSTAGSSTHFPAPPRNKADYKPLDPSSPSFLSELKEHYFPDLPHNPESLSWLRDPTDEEAAQSSYNPDRTGFAPSALRFDFKGNLITPSQSLEIPTTKGLHHHGDAPHSAGYTIPELTLLARSTMPNQRCIAYQITGRILYRLGRGDFGPRGGEMSEGLWACVERERILEVIMAEANRDGKGTHQSAKAYATEALWLWRRGRW